MTDSSLLPQTPEDMNETSFSEPLLTFAAVMTFLIMIVGIFGNGLTIAALLKCPKVRNVAAAFIISLCLADLLFCVFVLPFSGLRFAQGTWKHGNVLCKLIPFIQYGNIGVSLLCIAMITINRYVMIAYHTVYNRIYKRHWIAVMIAFCWIFAYGMQLPTLLAVWGKFDYDPKLGTCSIMTDEHGRSSKTALFITAFVIPCCIIIGCYTKIFWVVHESEARLKRHAKQQNYVPNNIRSLQTASTDNELSHISSNATGDAACIRSASKPTSQVKDQREMKAKRNEWRITKMVLAIFLSFVVCYLPITVVKVADKDVQYPVLHVLSYVLLYLSACTNPIIYVIMNKQYRKAYKSVLMCQNFRFCAKESKIPAEKWNDPALKNQPNQTSVSQMSIVDLQTVSVTEKPTIQITESPLRFVKDSTIPMVNYQPSITECDKLQDQMELVTDPTIVK